jgi:hypothetical protein
MAAMSVATRSASVALDFFIGNLLVVMTAIAQQAVYALGNCFFCFADNDNCHYQFCINNDNWQYLRRHEPLTESEAWEEQAKHLGRC